MAILYEHFNTGDDDASGIHSTSWMSQTFTPATAHAITSIKLKLYRIGLPGTLTASIRATDGGGLPTGADLASGTINGNTITTDTSGIWYVITLGAGYSLNASAKYAIVLKAPTGIGGSDYALWRVDSTSPTYTGGNQCNSTDGITWNADTTQDQMFEDWASSFIPKIFYF